MLYPITKYLLKDEQQAVCYQSNTGQTAQVNIDGGLVDISARNFEIKDAPSSGTWRSAKIIFEEFSLDNLNAFTIRINLLDDFTIQAYRYGYVYPNNIVAFHAYTRDQLAFTLKPDTIRLQRLLTYNTTFGTMKSIWVLWRGRTKNNTNSIASITILQVDGAKTPIFGEGSPDDSYNMSLNNDYTFDDNNQEIVCSIANSYCNAQVVYLNSSLPMSEAQIQTVVETYLSTPEGSDAVLSSPAAQEVLDAQITDKLNSSETQDAIATLTRNIVSDQMEDEILKLRNIYVSV